MSMVVIKLQRGNQRDCLMRVLSIHQRLIIGINHFENARIQVKFHRNCLAQKKVTFTLKQEGNNYIVYEIKFAAICC